MVYVVIGIIIIYLVVKGIIAFVGVIRDGVEVLADSVGAVTLGITAILCVIAFFAFGWIGVLVVAAIGLGLAFMLKKINEAIQTHDEEKRKTAQINQQTTQKKIQHSNQSDLQNELNKNCRWLGYMDDAKWKLKLGNYVEKEYDSSFENITSNFARQMEEQNILQNDDWFNPFLDYLANHDEGGTATQLLNIINCPQLSCTHFTSDIELVQTQLDKETVRISDDCPPRLQRMTSGVYCPTKFLKKERGIIESNNNHYTVIEDDDL